MDERVELISAGLNVLGLENDADEFTIRWLWGQSLDPTSIKFDLYLIKENFKNYFA